MSQNQELTAYMLAIFDTTVDLRRGLDVKVPEPKQALVTQWGAEILEECTTIAAVLVEAFLFKGENPHKYLCLCTNLRPE